LTKILPSESKIYNIDDVMNVVIAVRLFPASLWQTLTAWEEEKGLFSANSTSADRYPAQPV
jgi:hypothetical protein